MALAQYSVSNDSSILEWIQASKACFQRDVEKMTGEKNDLTARLEVLQNHIKTYQHQARDLQWEIFCMKIDIFIRY